MADDEFTQSGSFFLKRKPKQSRSRALVDAIAEAADQILGGREEDDPTVDAIAKRAGVGVGSVYDYFRDKDSLLGLVMTRVTRENYDRLAQRLELGPSDTAFDEWLPVFTRAVIDTYLVAPAKTRSLVRVAAKFHLVGTVTEIRDRFAVLLAERLVREEPWVDREACIRAARLLADMAMGIAVSEAWREPNESRREELAREMEQVTRWRLAPLRDNGARTDGA